MSCKDSVQSDIIIAHKTLPLACFSSSLPFTTESFTVNVMPYFTLLCEKLEWYFHFSYVQPFLIIQQFLLLPSSYKLSNLSLLYISTAVFNQKKTFIFGALTCLHLDEWKVQSILLHPLSLRHPQSSPLLTSRPQSFVTIGEPTLAHHYHLKFTAYMKAHPRCFKFSGLWQIYNDMHPPL